MSPAGEMEDPCRDLSIVSVFMVVGGVVRKYTFNRVLVALSNIKSGGSLESRQKAQWRKLHFECNFNSISIAYSCSILHSSGPLYLLNAPFAPLRETALSLAPAFTTR
jgi:hypothetical protein